MGITIATKDDRQIILNSLNSFKDAYKGGSNRIVMMDVEKTADWIIETMESGKLRMWLWNIDEGFMVGIISSMPYMEGVVAQEIFWHSKPAAKSGGAVKLINAFHEWGAEHQAVYYGLCVPKPRKALERLGYTEIETFYGRGI